jgi:hypothetical protein
MQSNSVTQTAGGSMMSDGGSMSGMITGAGGSINRSDSIGVSLSGDSFMYTQVSWLASRETGVLGHSTRYPGAADNGACQASGTRQSTANHNGPVKAPELQRGEASCS